MNKKKRNSATTLIEQFTSGGSATSEERQRPEGLKEGESSQNPKDYELTDEEVERYKVTAELEEALNRRRRMNTGKPKPEDRKPAEALLRYGDTRATFILKKDLVKKLKYISLMETLTIKEMMSEVLGRFVTEWESKNGEIQIKQQIEYERD